MADQTITMANGALVLKSDYVRLKTKDLVEFGYASLTEDDVREQVDKILDGRTDLSVIGLFCKGDLEI